MKRSSFTGFTLIELLVVIAIIAILAAILFPVFAKVREKARQTSCASNEKQIMMAAGQYSQDYDEYVVTATTANGGSGWDDLLYPYTANGLNHLANRNEWDVCPSDTIKRAANTNPRSYSLNWGGSKYNKNPLLDGPAGGWTTFGGAPAGGGFYAFTLAQIPAPSVTILLCERPNASNTTGSNSQAGNGYPNGQVATSPTGTPIPLHAEGWNYGFTDGHVKWMRPEQTMGKSSTGTCVGAVNATSNPCGMWTVDEND